ncbi:hypothetical protein [Halalkalirubrum salinum]|uniref:hypothetical protein n=1 Tax=Halalkalirubrum salinum TaxID=2563889 RepID=UPI0010FBB57F|nr:hypothetical protein [Halalkalirubrum salinum]
MTVVWMHSAENGEDYPAIEEEPLIFVFIPPYSLRSNAIEQLWMDFKRKISPVSFEDKDHFREFLTETFLRLRR